MPARRHRDGPVHTIDCLLDHVQELAEDLDGLVLDVKVGEGAFIETTTRPWLSPKLWSVSVDPMTSRSLPC